MSTKTEHTDPTTPGAELVPVEVLPEDGRRKVHHWPLETTTAPLFVDLFLEVPRRRQQVLRHQALAQAARDAAALGYQDTQPETAEA